MKNKKYVALGKKGSDVRWGKRHAALDELRKLVTKAEHNYLMAEAKTRTLLIIIELIRSTKHD